MLGTACPAMRNLVVPPTGNGIPVILRGNNEIIKNNTMFTYFIFIFLPEGKIPLVVVPPCLGLNWPDSTAALFSVTFKQQLL